MTRRFLLIFAGLLALTMVAMLQLYVTQWRLERSAARHEGQRVVDLAERVILGELGAVQSDMRFLDDLPTLHNYLEVPSDSHRKSLEAEFLDFVREKGIYDQLRLIDATGMELVRVQQAKGATQIVARANLQYKGDRYYFLKAFARKPGQLYVSPLDLNVEHGRIERPFKPMIRFGLPVVDAAGRKRGVLVVNYLGARIIDQIKALASAHADSLWLVNPQGYWLIGPHPGDAWGFMLPKRAERRFNRSYPKAWAALHRDQSGQIALNGHQFTYVWVNLATLTSRTVFNPQDAGGGPTEPGPELLLIERRPAPPLGSFAHPFAQRLLLLFAFLAVLMAGAAYALAAVMERKHHADADKRLAQERYAELVANLKVGICRLDMAAEGRIVDVDQALLRLIGVERREDLVGRPFGDLFAVPGQWEALTARLQGNGALEREVFELSTVGGQRFWAAITAFVQQGVGTASVEVILSDVSERKQAEDALRLSEERYRNLVEGSIQGIIIHQDFKPLFVNKALANIFSYASPEEVQSLDSVEPLIDPGARADIRETRERALREGSHASYFNRYQGIRKDGTKISVETIAQLVDWDGQQAHQVTVLDVTEKDRLEAQLRQSQKMEAVGQLAGGIAHDFNNILAVMSSYAELALDNVGTGHRACKDLQVILDATTRAAALTRQLLAFSRRQLLEMKILDVNRVVTNMEKMLQRVIGEDVNLRTALQVDLGAIKADESQIEQIIMNLAVNARDAMPTGGTLTIETARKHLDENYVESHLEVKPGDYVMLAVTDTGEGMDAETQRRIFEPFFTTKPMGKGTGLGLSTVYGIVKQMEGLVYVYSEPGAGTCFKIYFRRVDEPTQQQTSLAGNNEHLHGEGTILLVEDDVHVREATCRILASGGYEVLTAGDGSQALELAKVHQGRINLLISDVVMPNMSGRNVLAEVSQHGVDRVLFMSGYTDDAVVNHGILDGDFPFLHKPFSKKALLKKVSDVLHAPPYQPARSAAGADA